MRWRGRFFGMSFPEADEFNAVHGTQFIADLMPRSPIYVAMLTDAARAVMGQPHPTGRAALACSSTKGSCSTATSTFSTAARPSPREPTRSGRSGTHAADVGEIGDGGSSRDAGRDRALEDFRACYAWSKSCPGRASCIDRGAPRLLEVELGDEVELVAR